MRRLYRAAGLCVEGKHGGRDGTEETGRAILAVLERICLAVERAPVPAEPPLARPMLGAVLGGMTAEQLIALNKQQRVQKKTRR